MKKKDHDYSIYLAAIAIWMMVGGLAQCESAMNLDRIRQELSDIRYELKMMKYN